MKKIDSIIEISDLIALDINGQLSQHGKETLKKWIDSSEKNRQLYTKIMDGNNLAARNTIYESVDIKEAWKNVSVIIQPQQRRTIVPQILRYAAVLFIPLVIGLITYSYLKVEPQEIKQQFASIELGTSHAVLVLANGKNVNLTNDSTTNLTEKDGTVIKNSNKELVYNAQPSGNVDRTLLNTLIVPKGEEHTLILSDGTRVHVNSMSKLSFPVTFTGKKREISLEGEAFFEVTKDKTRPFIVTIKGLDVEVLGTSFNVKAYPDDSQSFTTLVEGKVRLNPDSKTSDVSFLEPDQQAVFDPSTSGIVIQKVDAKQFALWMKGKYTFTNQPLDEIMKTLSRMYDFNYQFEDPSLKAIRFEGGLNKYESIDPILDIIKETGKVKVTITGKDILFSKI